MKHLDQVIQRWVSQSLPLLPAIDPDRVISALSSTRKRFAHDLVEVYCTTGGIDGTMDDLYFSLWPLDRVRFDNLHSSNPDLAFADVLIDSFRFTLRVESETCSSVYGGYDGRRIANSLEDFWQIYLTDPHKLDLY